MESLLFALGVPACALGAPEPVPVILDTDIGDDMDDTWALAMLLGLPQLDLRLIVTAFRNTPERTRLAARMLEAMGRTDIPIGTGVRTEDVPHYQMAWLGDYGLQSYPGRILDDGVGALIEAVHASPRPVTILAIGPQTNLKAALDRDPSIAHKARIVVMAGSVYTGYDGKPGRAPEWNVVQDIPAIRAVLAAPWDITLVPTDICGTLALTGARYAAVAGSDHPRARTVIENYRLWASRDRVREDASSILFDTVAVGLALDETIAQMETIRLSVDDAGCTVPDDAGRPVRCGLSLRDRDAFEDLLVRTLTTDAG